MAIHLHLAQDDQADAVLSRNPLALLIGMLLDQQVPMERAFTGPSVITARLGAELDAHDLAGRDPEAFAALMAAKPAVHRYPGAMAERIQRLAAYLVDGYGGSAEALWRDAPDGAALLRRLNDLPGFGRQKAQIFLALLGKRLGVRPPGWREAAGPYGAENVYRSVADVVDAESLGKVRRHKAEMKRLSGSA
ncbi:HhH-GPD-type base excision DNA repair protein [Rhizohabitans arisaemae]|uniref:HhH-GPD-type base excision DNA repair protein n=1 Tax=Rhizohabitans arisaemae TaxID=2720610 RepID=UPI0024B0A5FE|nr:HhH-GPD-type base excision DNA repair protein [Rhizohabitans arisaemae]